MRISRGAQPLQQSPLARPHRSDQAYFDSKFEIKTTVHKQAEWRKNLAAAR
jgi:hypothetical protein